MIATFCIVSIVIGIIAIKKPYIFLVVILGSFFPYYFLIELFNVRLHEVGSVYIHGSFLLILLIYLFFKGKFRFTINNLDKFYVCYYFLWLIVFLINLDFSLFVFKPYWQAPYWVTITFILPIIMKPIYNQNNISHLIRYIEWLGYFSAAAIFISLLFGVTSKETGADYQITNWYETFRYTPVRGFFSQRQAWLLSVPIIIFLSRYMNSKLSKKEIIFKLPVVTLCFLGVIISGTRGTFLILSLFCFYLVIVIGNFYKKMTGLIVVAIIGAILLQIYYVPAYIQLFSRIFKASSYTLKVGGINTRYERYETGMKNFIEQPLIGNGMSKICYGYDYSHSSIISTLEDTGLLGFFIMCLMVIFLLHRCRWRYKKEIFTNSQFVIRNLIIFFFLTSNLYGTISTNYLLFLLIYMYYYIYRQKGRGFVGYISRGPEVKISLGKA